MLVFGGAIVSLPLDYTTADKPHLTTRAQDLQVMLVFDGAIVSLPVDYTTADKPHLNKGTGPPGNALSLVVL